MSRLTRSHLLACDNVVNRSTRWIEVVAELLRSQTDSLTHWWLSQRHAMIRITIRIPLRARSINLMQCFTIRVRPVNRSVLQLAVHGLLTVTLARTCLINAWMRATIKTCVAMNRKLRPRSIETEIHHPTFRQPASTRPIRVFCLQSIRTHFVVSANAATCRRLVTIPESDTVYCITI